jgi:Ca2+-binding EF-hand superfamily protein
LDTQGKGVLELEDMRFVSNQLRYNLSDEQLEEVIKNVGGYDASNISKDKFENFIERKIERVQRTNLAKRD